MMKAEDVMSKEVVTIKGSATVAEAVALMKSHTIGALIVEPCHEYDAYGIVSETDIVYKVTAYGKSPRQVRVFEIMSKPCVNVHPDLGIEYVAKMFANIGIRRAPVVQGELLGIISVTDIITKSDFVDSPKAILFEEVIQKAVEDARTICAIYGASSKVCTAAWDAVEELQAQAAYQKAENLISAKASFEEYCAANPDAPECRIYYED